MIVFIICILLVIICTWSYLSHSYRIVYYWIVYYCKPYWVSGYVRM